MKEDVQQVSELLPWAQHHVYSDVPGVLAQDQIAVKPEYFLFVDASVTIPASVYVFQGKDDRGWRRAERNAYQSNTKTGHLRNREMTKIDLYSSLDSPILIVLGSIR